MEFLRKNYNRYLLLAWVFFVIGFFLRFHRLDAVGLWSDELFSVSAALNVGHGLSWYDFTPKVTQELTFHDSFLTWKAADNSPPLFEFLLILWSKLFGTSDFSLRALPALLGSLSPAILFYGLRKRIGDFSAFLAAALLAISPSAVIYAQEVRSYTPVLFFCTIATVRVANHIMDRAFFSTVNKGGASSIWIDIFIFILMGYLHYTGLMMAAILAGIYVVFVSIPERKYYDLVKFLTVPLVVLPWMLLSKKAFFFSSKGGYAWRNYYPHEILDLMFPAMVNFFLPGYGVIFFFIWLIVLAVTLIGYTHNGAWVFTVSRMGTKILDKRIALAVAFMASIALLFVYSVYNAFTSKMWHPRYFAVALPVVFCSFALLFSSSKLNRIFPSICFLMIAVISSFGLFNYFYKDTSYKEEYREASAYISDKITSYSVILLNWRGNEAFYRHYLDKMLPGKGIPYSYIPVSTADDVRQLCNSIDNIGRHFFVFQHQSQTPLFEELGRCSGMKKVSAKIFRGVRVDEFIR